MDKKSATVTAVFFSMLVLTGFVSFLATRGSQAEEEKLPVQKNFLITTDPYTLNVTDVAELEKLTAEQKSNIKSLIISDTVLDVLDSETLRGFYNLQALKFAGGMLRNVSDGAFEDLKNLKRLDLSRNEFEELTEEFKNLINLEELDLDGTYVDDNEDPFYHLKNFTSLKYLNLAQIEFDFHGFPKYVPQSLVTLELRGTSFGEDIAYLRNLKNLYVKEVHFFGKPTIPDSLERLDMYHVYEYDKALKLITSQKNLKYLNVGLNTLANVSAFYDGVLNTKICENLLELNFSNRYGEMKHLPENAFEKCPNLQVLDLSVIYPQSNTSGLNELKSAWFEHSPKLQVVKLFNNGFSCQSETFQRELEKLKKYNFVLQDSDGKVVFRDQWEQHLCTVVEKELDRHHHHHDHDH